MGALQKRLRMEGLETRAMLAGDVTVEVVNGNLFIHGDDLDNAVSIVAGEEAGAYEIAGLPSEGGATTTINGQAAAFVATGVDGTIRVRLGDGNDSLLVNSLAATKLDLKTGDGDDAVTLAAGVEITGSATIDTGDGDDSVSAAGLTAGGKVSIRTGDGNDTLSITDLLQNEQEDDGDSNFNGRGIGLLRRFFGNHDEAVTFDLGNGDDAMTATNLTTFGSVSVKAGSGDDDVTLTNVIVGDNESDDNSPAGLGLRAFWNLFNRRGSQEAKVSVDGGNGDNVLTVNGLTAASLSLTSGRDDDLVSLTSINTEKLRLDLGSGDDSVALAASTVDELMVRLGRGDDDFSLAADVDVNVRVNVDAGFGIDTLVNALVSDLPLNQLVYRGFEIG